MEKEAEKSAAIRSMEERWKNLPTLLKEIKQSKGHTVQTIADGTGVSAIRLGKFFRGQLETINVDEIEAVCIFLGVSLDALLGNTNGGGSDERVRELEMEIRFLSERLAAAEKVEQKDALIMSQFDALLKSRGKFIAVLLLLIGLMVCTLLYYLGVDIANPDIGFVRDAYVAPMFFVVFAIIVGGIAMVIAMVAGLLREDKKNADELKIGGKVV